MRLLTALLENPQQVVTRKQLRERMWDTDTFVDYEQGINVAIKKVREALGDSVEAPKYIQTIAKKGYRFLLPVDTNGSKVAAKVVPDVPVDIARSETALPASRRLIRHVWLYGLLAVGILSAAGFWVFQHQKARALTQVHSIAVLPLRNLSPDDGQEYMVDGITEDLITNLAQTLPLRVISRTSIMRYKNTIEPIRQIARELGVEVIVEGSVVRSGERVAVTVQLIDALQDRHLWAQKYDRNLGDLLGMEAELSQQIATQVGGTLSLQHGFKTGSILRAVDLHVYELCLLGRYYWNKRTAAGLTKSADYFQQAIARDPSYAPAYAGLASAYALMPSYDSVQLEDSYAKATESARHALELDETLAEAHATLGLIALNFAGWASRESEFRRALELNPSYATAHHWYAYYLLFADRHAEAFAEFELARQLDPLSIIINADEGFFLYGERRYDEARSRLRQAIELAPDFDQPHESLALIALETGHRSEALQEARIGLLHGSINPRTLGEAGYVFAASGHPQEAQKLLTTLKDMVARRSASPIFLAFIYIGLGQRNAALDAIEECLHPN
ncbi:MAG TPA: winged helix-turn-helix domain-containing protein, partial [Terriglobales bacterium]|nr:winged helix-turn-helix domain-containing protein [Terriglobales bacterium]